MTSRLQNRRDTAANWTSNNPTLAAGEIGYETDTAKFKIGNGSTAWNSLDYAYTAGLPGATGPTGPTGPVGATGPTGPNNITSITAGTGLTGGTITTSGTVAIDTSVVTTLTGSQTLTNKTLGMPILISPEERLTVTATAATGTINFDLATTAGLFYTANASANFTLNFRGNSGTTLNSLLAVGDSITAVFLNTNGSSAFFANAFQVDGASVTPRFMFGTAFSAGNANSIDAYAFTIIKTAATPTFVVLASQARYA